MVFELQFRRFKFVGTVTHSLGIMIVLSTIFKSAFSRYFLHQITRGTTATLACASRARAGGSPVTPGPAESCQSVVSRDSSRRISDWILLRPPGPGRGRSRPTGAGPGTAAAAVRGIFEARHVFSRAVARRGARPAAAAARRIILRPYAARSSSARLVKAAAGG